MTDPYAILQEMHDKLAGLRTEQLIEMARELAANLTVDADMVADMVHTELEGRMEEGDFCDLMEEVEALMDGADMEAAA